MDTQEVFNRAWRHALNKQKSFRIVRGDQPHMACAYRGTTGASACLAGIFIPDDVYEPWMENRHFKAVVKKSPELRDLYDYKIINFIASLQTIHDEYCVDDWEDQLLDLAKRHRLSVPTGL